MSINRDMPTTALDRQDAKKQLAEMLRQEFGKDIHPNHLGYWLKSNWSIISELAHCINDVPLRTNEEKQ